MFASKDLFATRGGYRVTKSLRFRSSASAYLNRTFATPTSTTIWTWSAWVKRGGLTGTYRLFGASTTTFLTFNSSDQLNLTINNVSAATSTAVFRDPSAWYHIVYQQNGSAQTIWVNNQSVATGTTAASVFNTAIAHQIGAANTTNYFDGYLAEVNFIDGQALDATSFGQTDNNGVWQPKAYTGTYGTNGFYLKFADASGATATTIGKDSSPNGNNWTPNNISVASGTTYDSMLDSPTNYADGTAYGRGNYAVLNPLDGNQYSAGLKFTCSNGNLTGTGGASTTNGTGTIALPTGKWYVEFTVGSIATPSTNYMWFGCQDVLGFTGNGSGYNNSGAITCNGSVQGTYSTFTAGDVIGCAFDITNNQVSFYKNGVQQGTTGTLGVTTKQYAVWMQTNSNGDYFDANFGQRPFTYTPPAGFLALNTQNLPTPTIANGAAYMDATIYTGNGSSSRTFTGELFSPDLVWIKGRSGATDHALYDTVRGVQLQLESNNTGAETTESTGLTAFTADGFTIGSLAQINTNAATYVAWLWDESVTSGFDIVTYTGNGANRTISHSLNAVPSMIIVKQRTASSTTNWAVYHSSLANTEYILLNTIGAKATGATYWNSTTPTSSVFSLGTAADVNTNSGTYVAYCFAPVAGYSAFGSYTGNGSTDGPFVYTGFRPRWILIKRTDAANDWYIQDTSTNTYNVIGNTLLPNSSAAEASYTLLDALSNGFKLRNIFLSHNASGGIYIYAAFAENPFKISRAR